MVVNQIVELSAVLDSDHFQAIFSEVYNRVDYFNGHDDKYIDTSLMEKGITVIYRDSRYKKKISLLVNIFLVVDDTSDTNELIQKLNKRISKCFGYKYNLNDFTLSGMNLVSDIDVDNREKTYAYLKVLKRIGKVKGFSPVSDECFDKKNSFCLSGNSNGIDFLIYDLESVVMGQYKNVDKNRKKLCNQVRGVLRAEVRLTKPKAIRAYTDADDTSDQIENLIRNSINIFMDTFARIVPFGDFYKKGTAIDIIRREVKDSVMRRRMLRLLALIPEKRSLYLAQKAMNCRNIEKVMEFFAQINLSPVTISKRYDAEWLKSLYAYFTDDGF